MTFEQIIKDISNKKYHPVYFLTGEEPYYIDQISDLLEANVLDEAAKSFNQMIVYGKDTDFKAIVDDARQYPMFSTHRLIIVKEAQDMKDIQGLEKYITHPAETTILALCYKYKKIDKRTAFAKALTAHTLYFESKKIYDNQVPGWISSYTSVKGFKINPEAAALMADYIGADLSKLSNELEKLFINLGQQKNITLEDVREQIGISKNFDVFELQSALGLRDFKRAAMIIQYFSNNPSANPGVMIVASLYAYFNKVLIVKMHSKFNDADLAKAIGAHPFFLKEYKEAARNYTVDQMYHIMQALKKADMQVKGIGNRRGNDGSVYRDFLIACMQP